MNLPAKDSAAYRGIKTSLQAGIATFIVIPVTNFFIGLWGIQGVPEFVFKWLSEYVVLVLSSLGVAISSGTVAFIMNVLWRKDVKTY